MEHQRHTLGLWALTLGLSLALATSAPPRIHDWCYTWEQSPTWSCPDPDVMRVKAVQLGVQGPCSGPQCCPPSIYCERPAEDYNADLFTLITACEGNTSCNITYSPPNTPNINCTTNGQLDSRQVDYVKVYYTCENEHKATSSQEPSAHYTKTPTPTLTSPTQSTSDGHTTGAESVAPSIAGDGRAVDGKVNTDVLIGVTVTVACLILLTIVLVVVCVRRRKRGQKPTPATPSTGHRDTAAEDVYTVNDDDNYEIVQSPMATYHPELPVRLTLNPYLELLTPGPGSSSRDPETLHREPERTPEALDGGASGGEESRLEIHSVIHHARQEATELCLKDNELYGQIP